MRLEDFRKQYPQYNDISDEDLARGLHRRFYSDIPFEDFSQRVGLATPESGFFPALKAGVSGVQEAGYALAGRTGLMDEAAAQKAIEEEQAYQQRVFAPTEEGFLEAPVTGGQAGAENGKLTILCGGEKGVFEKSLKVLETYGIKIEYFGEAGMGQSAKMVNQICIAGIIQSLAEAINFAEKAGLETEKLMKTLSIGAGSSWQMNNRHELMLSRDYKENFGFPVEWMVKDLEIAIEEASKINADLKITKEVNNLFKKVKDEINPRFDTSSLILLLKKA